MKNEQFILVFFAAFAALLAGCAAGAAKDDSARVEQRAVERWNFLIAHQAEKAYDYLTPGYRATRTREQYAAEMNNRPVHWQAVKFTDRHCEADACDVHVEVTYKVAVPGNTARDVVVPGPITERWIKTEGKWYYLPKEATARAKPTKQ